MWRAVASRWPGVLAALSVLGSREVGVWVVGREPLSGAFVDESLVHHPPDDPEPCPAITQGVPRRDELRAGSVDLVLETTERCFPWSDWLSRPPAARSLTPSAKSTMSWNHLA